MISLKIENEGKDIAFEFPNDCTLSDMKNFGDTITNYLNFILGDKIKSNNWFFMTHSSCEVNLEYIEDRDKTIKPSMYFPEYNPSLKSYDFIIPTFAIDYITKGVLDPELSDELIMDMVKFKRKYDQLVINFKSYCTSIETVKEMVYVNDINSLKCHVVKLKVSS